MDDMSRMLKYLINSKAINHLLNYPWQVSTGAVQTSAGKNIILQIFF
jgi:hypothetical protein